MRITFTLILPLLLLFLSPVRLQVAPPTNLQTNSCLLDCFSKSATYFYCQHALEYGYCCYDATDATKCKTDTGNQIYCSNGLTVNKDIGKYMYCPRRTAACVTTGSKLRPLLNQNQTVSVKNLNSQQGDVCWWELSVDTTEFSKVNPNLDLKDVFINLVITSKMNMLTYNVNGISRDAILDNATTNGDVNRTYKYPLVSGSSVFLIAYPEDQN